MMSKKEKLVVTEGTELESFLDASHPLYQLANILNWENLIKEFGAYYVEKKDYYQKSFVLGSM